MSNIVRLHVDDTSGQDDGLVQAYDALRAADRAEGGLAVSERAGLLRLLRDEIVTRRDEIAETIAADFGTRSATEIHISETGLLLGAIDHALKHLRRWTKPRRVSLSAEFWPSRAEVRREPLGVVGVLGPWNYPLQLTLVPVVAALSGGNRMLVKPSEHTPRTAEMIGSIVKALPETVARCVTGGPEVAQGLTRLPLDHLFFTGGTETGRHVMRAAADTLTPVTLELGGKSPVVWLDDADLAASAESIMAGKLLNAGQTCIAPDYLLVPKHKRDAIVDALKTAANALYPDPDGPDYAALCRPQDRTRLLLMLDGQTAVPLFDRAPEPPKFGPHVVLDPAPDSAVMREEIFGPILPVLTYETLDEAIAVVNARPHPLALYVFGRDEGAIGRVLRETRSGGASVNECVLHVAAHDLPFGGVGGSGMGAYHGRAGFDAFTHERSVLRQSRWAMTRMARPPYGRMAHYLARFLTK